MVRLGVVALAVAMALVGCDSEDGQAGSSSAPPAWASAAPSGLGASVLASPDGAQAPPEVAMGPWPSVAPTASPAPWGDPARFPLLGLRVGMDEVAVQGALANANLHMLDLRTEGPPAVPEGEAWAYAESAYPAEGQTQSLGLRFTVSAGHCALKSVQANLSPGEREATLGGGVAGLNRAWRERAWGLVGDAALRLTLQGPDLVGDGASLRTPRSEGGDADVEGLLTWGNRQATVPLAEARFAEQGHLAEAFLAPDGHRLVLLERLPFSGLRVPHFFRLKPDGRAFEAEVLDPS